MLCLDHSSKSHKTYSSGSIPFYLLVNHKKALYIQRVEDYSMTKKVALKLPVMPFYPRTVSWKLVVGRRGVCHPHRLPFEKDVCVLPLCASVAIAKAQETNIHNFAKNTKLFYTYTS